MILSSLLDTDCYKLTMMQAVFHRYANTQVEYTFHCRTPNVSLAPFAQIIHKELNHLASLRFQDEDIDYLHSLGYFKDDFLHHLRQFKLDSAHLHLSTTPHFSLKIKGPWLDTILWEVPLLAIINEVYFQTHDNQEGEARLAEKIKQLTSPQLQALHFSDFGTRRRFSRAWQHHVVKTLQSACPQQLTSTSNLWLAKTLNLPAMGTMAHEFLQAMQVLAPSLAQSQHFAFSEWLEEYPHQLGIALSDIYNQRAFLADFDQTLAQRYQGARHDSGDPVEWGESLIQHYERLGIDPKEKTFVFSDGLTIDKMIMLYQHFHQRIQLSFGIGTHLTNDTGSTPIDIVLKMSACNGQPVAKLSNNPHKVLCNDATLLKTLTTLFPA